MDFITLLPDTIFNAVSEQGYRPTGALFSLNSYENRVYDIAIEEGEPVVAKFYRPNRWSAEQIREEHLFVSAVANAEIPAVEPLILKKPTPHHVTIGEIDGYFYALYPKFRGREEPDLNNEKRKWLGRSLGRLHNVGESFLAKHRLQLDPETYGYQCLDTILDQSFLSPDLAESLETYLLRALELVEIYYRPGLKLIPLHGDCHLGNVLWNHAGPHLLDFDDMIIAPPAQDVWMLFSGDKNEVREQQEAFFEGYETFRKFDMTTLILMEPLRTLRMIHYAAWIGRRFEEPAFQRAFPYYRENRYWEELLLAIKEQISLMQELD